MSNILKLIVYPIVVAIIIYILKTINEAKQAKKEMNKFKTRIHQEFIQPLENFITENKEKNYDKNPRKEIEKIISIKKKEIKSVSKEIKHMKTNDNKIKSTQIIESLNKLYEEIYKEISSVTVQLFKDFSEEELLKNKRRQIDKFYKDNYPKIKKIILNQKIFNSL